MPQSWERRKGNKKTFQIGKLVKLFGKIILNNIYFQAVMGSCVRKEVAPTASTTPAPTPTPTPPSTLCRPPVPWWSSSSSPPWAPSTPRSLSVSQGWGSEEAEEPPPALPEWPLAARVWDWLGVLHSPQEDPQADHPPAPPPSPEFLPTPSLVRHLLRWAGETSSGRHGQGFGGGAFWWSLVDRGDWR